MSRNRGQSCGWSRPGEKPRVRERPDAPEALPAMAISSRSRRRRGTLERPPPRPPVEERSPLTGFLPNIGNQEGEIGRSKLEVTGKGIGC